MSRPREFWIVRSNHCRDGWCYSDRESAEKRLSSGLKSPPVEWDYHIVHVREVVAADAASDKLIAAEAEIAEQCRLNGMGAQRELALMTRLASATQLIEKLEAALQGLHDDTADYMRNQPCNCGYKVKK